VHVDNDERKDFVLHMKDSNKTAISDKQ
jgi:hypothetical protein